ncbi:MAG: helix-turn-helix domain-containing protein [Candidatus Eisenbacteria bacterium]|nr:helix-turn-helix domain-containing protein [Candidatus Eisenbacteria bacterium]
MTEHDRAARAARAAERHATPPGPPQRLLTIPEIADLLQLSGRTIRRLVASRRLPCVRLGRQLRFDPADVVRFVTARKE